MRQIVRQAVKELIPPILLSLFKHREGRDFFGDFSSWEEAEAAATGYDDRAILRKVEEALSKVKSGEAVYERDSVLFDEIQYAWPLLAGLMWVAANSGGSLNIVDFGGSLGSTYFQNRKFLAHLKGVRWNIVEQAHFVDLGRERFEDGALAFFYDLETCLAQCAPNAILFSSVLQYVESPYTLLKEVMSMGFEVILIDRTSFVLSGADRLTVQKVPAEIYEASYPHWFFDPVKFYSMFDEKYHLVERFDTLGSANIPSKFEGAIFKKK